MFTATEKKYLTLTLVFLATGSGIKAYRHAHVQIGPMEDSRFLAADSTKIPPPADSLGGNFSHVPGNAPDSLSPIGISPIGSPSPAGSKVWDSSSASKPDKGPGSKHPREAPGHKAAFTGKVSLNHAGPGELTAIRGIGEKTAQIIVQYRKEHGPFRELRELLQVKGIGEKKLEKIVPFLIL